jgi:large subunit ribosomal protein L13
MAGRIYMKTRSIRSQDVRHDWLVVDAADRTLGRIATEIAHRLRGKHKPEFTPHVDTGDYIIVVNAEKVRVTGRKTTDKIYYRHSGYPGGIKGTSFERLRDTHPERIIENAVRGMLPRNPLGRAMFRKLKVYAGPDHPHAAQQPQLLEI